MALLKEFKEFIMRGNVLDLAVALVLGIAFGAVVTSFVDDVLMPAVGLLLGGQDFSDLYWVMKEGAAPLAGGETLAQARAAGAVVMAYGVFVNTIITFVIIAFVIFMIVKAVNNARKNAEKEATTQPCPHCLTDMPIGATRCPHCTAMLAG